MLNIILTIDYEIFGNGRGDPKRHILKPAQKLINIAEEFSVPLTIMFEVFEYIAYEKYDEEIINKIGYSPAKLIKKQIREAYQKGNDIQLHIHPQFIDMCYRKGKFLLKKPDLSILDFDEKEVYEILQKSKEKLLSILNDTKYKCTVLRLSNMPWIEAPNNALYPMKKMGLKIHSLYSYNPKNNLGLWKINNSDIYEIPIYNLEVNYLELISLRRLLTLLYIWLNNPSLFLKWPSQYQKLPINKRKKINLKWDLSKLSHKEMINFLKVAIDNFDIINNEIPLVMIGHTKDFFNQKNLREFLKITKKNYVEKGVARFTTFNEFQERYLSSYKFL